MQYFSKSCTLFQVWNDLKRETNGARNKLDLIRKIVNWWKTKENDLVYCNKKFDHLPKVIDMCIAMPGAATGL
jgi:hypothetical protein